MSDIPKEYAEILEQFDLDDDCKEFVRMFLELDPDDQEYINKVIKKQLSNIKNKDQSK